MPRPRRWKKCQVIDHKRNVGLPLRKGTTTPLPPSPPPLAPSPPSSPILALPMVADSASKISHRLRDYANVGDSSFSHLFLLACGNGTTIHTAQRPCSTDSNHRQYREVYALTRPRSWNNDQPISIVEKTKNCVKLV